MRCFVEFNIIASHFNLSCPCKLADLMYFSLSKHRRGINLYFLNNHIENILIRFYVWLSCNYLYQYFWISIISLFWFCIFMQPYGLVFVTYSYYKAADRIIHTNYMPEIIYFYISFPQKYMLWNRVACNKSLFFIYQLFMKWVNSQQINKTVQMHLNLFTCTFGLDLSIVNWNINYKSQLVVEKLKQFQVKNDSSVS